MGIPFELYPIVLRFCLAPRHHCRHSTLESSYYLWLHRVGIAGYRRLSFLDVFLLACIRIKLAGRRRLSFPCIRRSVYARQSRPAAVFRRASLPKIVVHAVSNSQSTTSAYTAASTSIDGANQCRSPVAGRACRRPDWPHGRRRRPHAGC